MSSTLFWFIFNTKNRLSDIVQLKEQQYSNKYVIRHKRIDLQALITVKQALVLFLQYSTEAEEHSLVSNFIQPFAQEFLKYINIFLKYCCSKVQEVLCPLKVNTSPFLDTSMWKCSTCFENDFLLCGN